MLYRAVGRVLLVVSAPSTGSVAVNVRDRIRHIRSRKSNLEREQAPKAQAASSQRPVRPPPPPETAGDPKLAAAMRPRPGIDTNVWDHDRAALHELYLLGARREFDTKGFRRLMAFLSEQRTCN